MPQTIIVTGSRKGIGRFLVEYYIKLGFNVVGCSRSESNFIHEKYLHVICDVSIENSAKQVIKEAINKFNKIDILINNAGIASLNHSILTPGTTVQKVFETNFFGSFYFSREVAKHMMRTKGGKIINFSTVAVPLDLEGEMIYASSKAAVEKMTKIMSKELASSNIQINAIGPTPIATDLIKTIPSSKIDDLISKQSIKRLGTYDDIANVINFFIKPESSMITGQILYLGGL
jgi:3-oxoacyl-[acyl-carrier protein] reductase